MIETLVQEQMLEIELNSIKNIIYHANIKVVDCLTGFIKENCDNDAYVQSTCQLLKQSGILIQEHIKNIENIIN